MKIIFIISLVILFSEVTASADDGYVVKIFSGCDYFIADGPKGLYVIEWFGEYDPSEGDTMPENVKFGIKAKGFLPEWLHFPDFRDTCSAETIDFQSVLS